MNAVVNRAAIRTASDEDFSLLPAIESCADELFRRRGIEPLPPPAGADEYRSAIVVLVAGNPPIGFSRVIEVDGDAHLEQISVTPEHMRKGIGSQLLRCTIHAVHDRGYSRLTLITFRDVAWNARFYLNRGFHPLSGLTSGLEGLRQRERRLGLDRLGPRVVLALDF